MNRNRKKFSWKAIAIDDSCFEIRIEEDIELRNAKVRVVSDTRSTIAEFQGVNIKDKFSVCLYTGKPLFVEIIHDGNTSVEYVKNSGADFYQKPS